MSSTHPTDITTEWDELQIKYGNYPQRPKAATNEELTNRAIDLVVESAAAVQADSSSRHLSRKDLERLGVCEEEEEEGCLLPEEALLHAYRRQRLEQLKKQRGKGKFGEVVQVGKDEYLSQVTEASKAAADSPIVLHLYSTSQPICELINRALDSVARRHPSVKFCRAVASDVIPGYPDRKTPTVIVYRQGVCVQQLAGGAVFGGERSTADTVEWVLWKKGVLEHARCEEDPRGGNDNSRLRAHGIRYDDDDGNAASSNTTDSDDDAADDDGRGDRANDRGFSSIQMERVLGIR